MINRYYGRFAQWDSKLNLINIEPIDLQIIKLYTRQNNTPVNPIHPKLMEQYLCLCHKQAGTKGIKIIKQLLKNNSKDKSK